MAEGQKPRGETGQHPREVLPGLLGGPLQAPITKECTHYVHALLPLAVKKTVRYSRRVEYGRDGKKVSVTTSRSLHFPGRRRTVCGHGEPQQA